jgi:hypothetical protein
MNLRDYLHLQKIITSRNKNMIFEEQIKMFCSYVIFWFHDIKNSFIFENILIKNNSK